MSRFPLLPRKKHTDKSDYGHVLVVAGSRGMSGAAILSARAAYASGAGLVTLAVPEGLEAFIAKRSIPEIMVRPVPARGGCFYPGALNPILKFIADRKISCVALGPGLSTTPQTQKFARLLVKKSPVPVVLDADGLNSFQGRPGELLGRKSALVMTPHAREFQRIFSKPAPDGSAEKKKLVLALSRMYKTVIVLKSHRTFVVGGRKFYVNHTGNPGMAKGGSGDVLTGMTAAFMAQELTPFEAARWAVYFHGRAGDLAVRRKGELGLLASDIIEYLPAAFRSG